MKILVVDDDVRTAQRFARLLEEDGYQVEVFGDGVQAIERLDAGPPPDVVITDVLMPRASGIAVMEHARAARPGIVVIFVTGHPELLARLAPSEPEPVVFTKPIQYAAVNAALGDAARAQHARPVR
jgi:two-component system response regulator MprA